MSIGKSKPAQKTATDSVPDTSSVRSGDDKGAVMFHVEKDYDEAKRCRNDIMEVLTKRGVQHVKFWLYGEITDSPFQARQVKDKCSLYFFYLSKNTDSGLPGYMEIYLHDLASLTRLSKDPESKYAVCPIYSVEGNKPPEVLLSTYGINWYDSQSSQTIERLVKMFKKPDDNRSNLAEYYNAIKPKQNENRRKMLTEKNVYRNTFNSMTTSGNIKTSEQSLRETQVQTANRGLDSDMTGTDLEIDYSKMTVNPSTCKSDDIEGDGRQLEHDVNREDENEPDLVDAGCASGDQDSGQTDISHGHISELGQTSGIGSQGVTTYLDGQSTGRESHRERTSWDRKADLHVERELQNPGQPTVTQNPEHTTVIQNPEHPTVIQNPEHTTVIIQHIINVVDSNAVSIQTPETPNSE
ncbi:hypothetical protein ScPMuIL_008130 [Solemya velum]